MGVLHKLCTVWAETILKRGRVNKAVFETGGTVVMSYSCVTASRKTGFSGAAPTSLCLFVTKCGREHRWCTAKHIYWSCRLYVYAGILSEYI